MPVLRMHPLAGVDSQRGQEISTRLVFFIAGFGMAAWAPIVPFAKARIGADDRTLGFLLLCMGLGSIIAMPAAGVMTGRFGSRPVIAVASVLLCVALPLLATLSDLPLLAPTLAMFGAAIGSLDVAMNTQAVIVERAGGRRMMSGFHGLFSLGGIAGAAGMTLLFMMGASPLGATLSVAACIAAALAIAMPHLLTQGSRHEGPVFVLSHGAVLFVGLLCFTMFLTEGAVLDWSAVFLTSVRGVAAADAGLGYAAFALAMTAGRFAGDRIVHRFGGGRTILWGGLCAAAGFAIATLCPVWPLTLAGYALVGAGCSNIVPVLFTSAGRHGMPESIAVSAITTLGYAGILTGPAAIGFIAHAAGLSTAFMMLVLLLAGVAASGPLVRI